MKKSYVKPELFYESFVLSQHIAGCNVMMNPTVEENCTGNGTITDNFGTMNGLFFLNGNENCTTKVERYCYTNGAGTIVSINS